MAVVAVHELGAAQQAVTRFFVRPALVPASTFTNQGFTGYNMVLTTKWAGTNRPFFLGVCFWSSKPLGVVGFFVFSGIN